MKLHFRILNCIVGIALAYGTPLFYNPGQALSLIVSSSSDPTTPTSNIADLRNSKVQQLEKLQNDDSNPNQSFFSDSPNEATPGFFQKKIAKIFAKLQLFSSLSSFSGSNDNNEDDFEINKNDNDGETTETTNVSIDSTTSISATNSSEENPKNDVETLRQFRRETFAAEPIQTPPYVFPRVVGAIVNLAYRMIHTPFNIINRDIEIVY